MADVFCPDSPPTAEITTSELNGSFKMSDNREHPCVVPSDSDSIEDFPTYLAMAKMRVTLTGFTDKVLQASLCSKIRQMCGDVVRDCTRRTTHVLAAHGNTGKVIVGRSRKLPVISAEWVDHLWELCQQNSPYFHASLCPELTAFECKLFHNLRFVFSRLLDSQEKEYYKFLATKYGATVKKNLKTCSTYLYFCEAQDTTRSFDYATSNGVRCLRPGWIAQSIYIGNIAQVLDYEVKKAMTVNTGPVYFEDWLKGAQQAHVSDDFQGNEYPCELNDERLEDNMYDSNSSSLNSSIAAKFASMEDLTVIGDDVNAEESENTNFRSAPGKFESMDDLTIIGGNEDSECFGNTLTSVAG